MGGLGTNKKLTQHSLSHFGVSFLSGKEKPRLMFLVPHRFPKAPTPHLWLGAVLRS